MDFSAWNWATSFRVHEAACLIAGVMPISKRQPTSEELPPQARPILVKLMAAYVEWILQKKNPDRPKSIFLEGYLNDDGTPPEINSLAELPGSLVSREAINRFLSEIEGELGLKSACDFGPIRKTADPLSMDGQRLIQATPTPVEPDPKRRLTSLCEVLTGQEAAEQEATWFDATLDAAGFFALGHVSPVEAAMLLCRHNPHEVTEKDAEAITCDPNCSGEITPNDFKRLRRTFVDLDHTKPGNRPLMDWMRAAAGAGRRIHPWAHRYAKHHGLYGPEKEPAPAPVEAPAAPATDTAPPAPVVTDSASTVPGKVWTPEKLAEMKAYREKHGTKKAAVHYQVSESRIRKLLPSDKPKPKGYSVFMHH